MNLHSISCTAFLVMQLCMSTVRAGPEARFEDGNRAYAEGRFEEAMHAYQDAAMEASTSAEAHYNLGNAQYRQQLYTEAGASFEAAATMAETDRLRSRSWYNLGNCLVRTAETVRTHDLQAALATCREAVWVYRSALQCDPAFQDAAYNLEVSQHTAAAILGEIRDQEEEEQKKSELIRYIRKKLQEFIQRQSDLIDSGTTGSPQHLLEAETRALGTVMENSGLHVMMKLPDGDEISGPLRETYDHTVLAADAMAAPDPPTALAELMAALGAVPEDPGSPEDESDGDSDEDEAHNANDEQADQDADIYEEADPFGDFSAYEEIRGVPPPNQSEADILAEEARNLEQRKERRAAEYKAVEKDW